MRAGQGQTLIDVAVMHGGSAEAVWEIAERSGVGLTDGTAGVELEVPSVAAEPETVAAMGATGANPATDGEARRESVARIGETIIGIDKIG